MPLVRFGRCYKSEDKSSPASDRCIKSGVERSTPGSSENSRRIVKLQKSTERTYTHLVCGHWGSYYKRLGQSNGIFKILLITTLVLFIIFKFQTIRRKINLEANKSKHCIYYKIKSELHTNCNWHHYSLSDETGVSPREAAIILKLLQVLQ